MAPRPNHDVKKVPLTPQTRNRITPELEVLEDRLTPSFDLTHSLFPDATPQSGARFGNSVATDGNFHVVGAFEVDTDSFGGNGEAYVFDAATNKLLTVLENPDPDGSNQFGHSVAISNGIVVVGVPSDDEEANNSGRAYVFNAATGDLQHTLLNPTLGSNSEFGFSVAISGNIIVVGARVDDTLDSNVGQAYIFDATTGALLHTLANPAPDSGDEFGYSVAVSGSTVVVGARNDDDLLESNSGRVFVFDANTGNLEHTINNPSADPGGNQFGASVSVSGNTILIGSLSDDDGVTQSGKAHLYDATSGNLLHTLSNPTPESLENFGNAVSLSGTTAIIAAYRDDTDEENNGEVYVFDTASGNLLQTLTNPTVGNRDEFGFSVSVSGNTVVVGAHLDDLDGRSTGQVSVHNAATGDLVTILENPTPAAQNQFGEGLSLSGNKVAVGAPFADDTTGSDRGQVYLFDTTTGDLELRLDNPSPDSGGNFGKAISLVEDKIVVGASSDQAYLFDTTNGNLLQTYALPNSFITFGLSLAASSDFVILGTPNESDGGITGQVRVYDFETGNLLHIISNPNVGPNDQFGASVAISGTTIVVAAPWESSNQLRDGKVYLFDTGTGNLLQTLDNPSPALLDQFGSSVAIYGETVLVGALGDDSAIMNSGQAYLFDSTTGNLLRTIDNPTAASNEQFGFSVDLSGNLAVIGNNSDDSVFPNSGEAFVFDVETGNLIDTLENPNPAEDYQFGYRVAISGETVAVSTPFADTQNSNQGTAYLFQNQTPPPPPQENSAEINADGDLVVTGSSRRDYIFVDARDLFEVQVISRGGPRGTFDLSEGGHIIIQGGNERDVIRVHGNADFIIDGGAGNDRIITGNGSDIIFGGEGNDRIFSGGGDDVIVGGLGKDRLDAGSGDDIQIGGETSLTTQQLIEELALWTANTDVMDVTNLSSMTVQDPEDRDNRDRLFATLGSDLNFFGGMFDRVSDKDGEENVDIGS